LKKLKEQAEKTSTDAEYNALMAKINNFPPELEEDKTEKKVPSGDFIV